MRAPLSWLRDFAPFGDDIDQLSEALSNLGLVVEGVDRAEVGFTGVVVARILDVRPHPSADRVRLVDVDAGDGKPLQVGCGGSNLHEGDLVAFATVGAVLPGGFEISRRKLRGEWSNGMICSVEELDTNGDLGLTPPVGDKPILVLPPDIAKVGTALPKALGIDDDVVFDIDVTPNRPDALSMAGIARDLAAALDLPFALPSLDEPAISKGLPDVSIRVEAPELCPSMTGTVVDQLPRGSSPSRVARRLALAGMRPISAVVDATNYVMLEVGQPVHAYDLDRLPGRGLEVRRGRKGEKLITLDDNTRKLTEDDCVIADAKGEAVGLAGIMGGASSEVTDKTETVLLEAAWFSPLAVAATGNRLGLHSEARARFERGVDPDAWSRAVAVFVSLLPGCRRGPTQDVRSKKHLPAPAHIELRTARVNAILGTSLDEKTIAGHLRSIDFTVRSGGTKGVLEVTVPSWRPDTSREIDLIEEVARLHGYAKIERRVPEGGRAGVGFTQRQRSRRAVRQVLVGAGLAEAWTTTFLAPEDLGNVELETKPVVVANPLDQSESVLRPTLLPGLLKAIRYNETRQLPDVRLFEVGRVFVSPKAKDPLGLTTVDITELGLGPRSGDLPVERERIAGIVAGAGADGRLAAHLWSVLAGGLRIDSASLVAGALPGLHGGRSARIVGPEGESVGVVGEVEPDVASRFGLSGRIGYFEVDLDALIGLPRRTSAAPAVSRYPASDIDLAFVVPEKVPAARVETCLTAAGGELLESVRLFDVYRRSASAGAGAKQPDAKQSDGGAGGVAQPQAATRSLAYRLRFRADDRTLTDKEVAAVRERCIEAVTSEFGASLRG